MMDITLPEEMRILQKSTRKFAQKELLPVVKEIDEKEEIPARIIERFKELGYFGMTIPQEFGGMGMGTMAFCLVQQELAKIDNCFNLLISGNNGIGSMAILLDGSAILKEKYLSKLASGKNISAFALSEPGAGSDAAAIQCKAEKRGNKYILNGMKHFITRGDIADIFTVMAVTDREKRAHGGISAFIVEKGFPGFSLGRVQKSMGPEEIKQTELVFENCEVPEENLIGEEGKGFATAMKVLDNGRLFCSARALGIAERLLKMSVDYANQRVQFGKPIAARQAIQWMIADMAIEIYATKCMVYTAAQKKERGEKLDLEPSIIKVYATEMVNRAADSALQIHGGMGYMKDFPIEKIYRDVRVMRIYEGTSEIQRMIIARGLLSGG